MMQETHGVTHWQPDVCFGCRVKTIQYAPSIFFTTPGGAKAHDNRVREGKLEKDLSAYKRMRLAGEHPRSTRGAATIESQAESSFEIESGQLAHKRARGLDAGKSISRRGKEWRKRSEEAHQAVRRGEVVSPL